MSSNLQQFNTGIDLWLKRVRNMTEELYQEMIWDLFKTVVRETPQWSGKAVANWNLSIGSPNMEWELYGDANAQERGGLTYGLDGKLRHNEAAAPHQKGDRKWATFALNRNRPILKSVKVNDRVFISNGVMGNQAFEDAQDFAYLEAFQTPGKWQDRLRQANLPFQSVQESVMIVTSRWTHRGFNYNTTRGDRTGGFTLDQE